MISWLSTPSFFANTAIEVGGRFLAEALARRELD